MGEPWSRLPVPWMLAQGKLTVPPTTATSKAMAAVLVKTALRTVGVIKLLAAAVYERVRRSWLQVTSGQSELNVSASTFNPRLTHEGHRTILQPRSSRQTLEST
jgi:hypothetical protein